jgi:hypothetical protein
MDRKPLPEASAEANFLLLWNFRRCDPDPPIHIPLLAVVSPRSLKVTSSVPVHFPRRTYILFGPAPSSSSIVIEFWSDLKLISPFVESLTA